MFFVVYSDELDDLMVSTDSYPDIQKMEAAILVEHFPEVSAEFFEVLEKIVKGNHFDVLKTTIAMLRPTPDSIVSVPDVLFW